jgi:hypothetical protein
LQTYRFAAYPKLGTDILIADATDSRSQRDPSIGGRLVAICHRHTLADTSLIPQRQDNSVRCVWLTEIAYEDTEHYAITRDFLNNYPKRLQQLLASDESDYD